LSAVRNREDALDHALDVDLDVLVIGGGITGAGVALDAASRGYRVALVERSDLASGTSSKSSKLVHGGVRYLANADVSMVVEGVRERDRMRRNAPHLVRPLGFVIPVDSAADRIKIKAGMSLYDVLSAGRAVRPHAHLGDDEVAQAAPGLVRGASKGAYRYYDAQTDDARLTLAIAQASRTHGADIINHADVIGLLESGGRVVGAQIRDRLSGEDFELRARWVVSATGVWAADLWGLTDAGSAMEVVPAKGTHVTLPGHLLPLSQALVLPSGAGDGRMNFVIPWGEQTYIGTTDDPFEGGLDDHALEQTDANYLLASVNEAFDLSLTVQDCIGAWSGLRPLLRSKDQSDADTKDLSRKHTVVETPNRLVTVTGGKLTTWRQMAQDVVDHLVAGDGASRRCVTAELALGASGNAQDGLARVRRAVVDARLDPALSGSLYHRHGDRAEAVLTRCIQDGETEVLVPGLPYLLGEVRHAVEHELARSLDDVLQRRMRVSLRDAAAGGVGIARAADICADVLGWDATKRDNEIAGYLANVRRERGPVPIRP
jgi:glycerol-3-phosphate dehydrogenase